MAKVVTAADIAWSDGSAFQGALILVFVPPELGSGNYPDIFPRMNATVRSLPKALPQRIAIPIENGVLQDNFIFKSSEIDPPNTLVLDFWVDTNGATIANGSTLLNINVDEYTITVPTLPVPTAETSLPSLTYAPTAQVITTITAGVLSRGDLGGSGVARTIPVDADFVMVFKNRILLLDPEDYSRSGTSITLTNAPSGSDVLEYILYD